MLLTAFILGFAGSIHCAGMCSPLLMAVTNLSKRVILSRVYYNAGRIVTYGIIGSLFSSLGTLLFLTRFQNLISIALGVLLLTGAIIGFRGIRIPLLSQAMSGLTSILKRFFSKLLSANGFASTFTIGMINGLLPCGLSFLALTYCVTLSPANGLLFMIAFGFGTLPVMLGFTSAIKWFVDRMQWEVKMLNSVMSIIAGSVLIARALFLGIAQSHSTRLADIILCR